jgi:hypothetical protein
LKAKKADEAKTRAANIARLMLHKIQTVSAKINFDLWLENK